MKCLYQLVREAWFNCCLLQEAALLLSLCFCHSILLERKTFPQLGRNIVHDFGDSDFEVKAVSDTDGDSDSCWIEQSKNRKIHFCLHDIGPLRLVKVS